MVFVFFSKPGVLECSCGETTLLTVGSLEFSPGKVGLPVHPYLRTERLHWPGNEDYEEPSQGEKTKTERRAAGKGREREEDPGWIHNFHLPILLHGCRHGRWPQLRRHMRY